MIGIGKMRNKCLISVGERGGTTYHTACAACLSTSLALYLSPPTSWFVSSRCPLVVAYKCSVGGENDQSQWLMKDLRRFSSGDTLLQVTERGEEHGIVGHMNYLVPTDHSVVPSHLA